MFAWIKKLFQNHEESENEFGNREAKIRDIRRRIEEQKQAIGYHSTQSVVNVEAGKVLAETSNMDAREQKKNHELDALKAKLLGKNKSSNK